MEIQKAHEILGEAHEKNRLLAFYTEPGSSRFDVGFVEAWSEKHFVIRTVSISGLAVGFSLRRIEDLCRVEWESEYLEGIQNLFHLKGATHINDFLPEIDLSSDLLSEFLLATQNHDFMVEINIGSDCDPRGFVREVGITTLTIEAISDQGRRDGISVVVLEDIGEVEADNTKLRDLKMLARWSDQAPPL